jgi:hypothetical protein
VPVRRLVLPREVVGVNAFDAPGTQTSVSRAPTGPGDPADLVVLVVPSPARLLQAGWIDALHRRSWSRFADWLPAALDDPEAGWRYDRLVARWAGSVGADRVHVVAGDDPAAAGAVLSELAGEPVTPLGWTRTLSGAEVVAVEALVAELEELGLDGRNAADMLDGAVAGMVRTPAVGGTGPAADAVPEGARERVAAEADRMLVAVDASGVHLHGDRSALQGSGTGVGERVGLDAAVALSVGALERVATWTPSRESA